MEIRFKKKKKKRKVFKDVVTFSILAFMHTFSQVKSSHFRRNPHYLEFCLRAKYFATSSS